MGYIHEYTVTIDNAWGSADMSDLGLHQAITNLGGMEPWIVSVERNSCEEKPTYYEISVRVPNTATVNPWQLGNHLRKYAVEQGMVPEKADVKFEVSDVG